MIGSSIAQLTVDRAGRNEDVDAVVVRRAHSLVRFLDVIRVAAGEAGDDRSTILFGDRPHRVEVSRGCCRKTGFDNVDTKVRESLGNAELLTKRHAAARSLLAISQGRVIECGQIAESLDEKHNFRFFFFQEFHFEIIIRSNRAAG